MGSEMCIRDSIISEIDVDVSRALVPATVECDVLPSVDVDRSGISIWITGSRVN